MAYGLKDTGEEAIIRDFFEESLSKPSSVDVSLYNDSTDTLSDSEDVGDITTEPGGASFSRQSVNFGTNHFTAQDSGGNWEAEIANTTFDTSDSTQTVDSYFIVITFTSQDKGDGSATDHLLFTGSLGDTYDLSTLNSYTLGTSGLSVD